MCLHVKQEGDDVTIPDRVIFTLQTQQPFPASLSQTAALDQVVVADYLSPDETPFHIGVDFAGGFKGSGAVGNGAGTDFTRGYGKK